MTISNVRLEDDHLFFERMPSLRYSIIIINLLSNILDV